MKGVNMGYKSSKIGSYVRVCCRCDELFRTNAPTSSICGDCKAYAGTPIWKKLRQQGIDRAGHYGKCGPNYGKRGKLKLSVYTRSCRRCHNLFKTTTKSSKAICSACKIICGSKYKKRKTYSKVYKVGYDLKRRR